MVNKKENTIKLVELEISNMEYAIELAEKIKPVIEKFNGKVLNKRLETALKEIDEHIYTENRYGFKIGYYVENNRIPIIETDYLGKEHRHNIFTKQSDLPLTSYLTTNTKETDRCIVDENNRIKADVIIAGIDNQKEYFEMRIEELKTAMPKVDEYKERIENIKKQMKELNDEIPYLIKSYFDLYYDVKKY